MVTLPRALPAQSNAVDYFAFANDDDANNNFTNERIVPIYRPVPSEEEIDQTIADSFPASDPPAWY